MYNSVLLDIDELQEQDIVVIAQNPFIVKTYTIGFFFFNEILSPKRDNFSISWHLKSKMGNKKVNSTKYAIEFLRK